MYCIQRSYLAMTELRNFALEIARCLAHPNDPPQTLLDLVTEVLRMPEACALTDLLEMQRRMNADPLASRPIGLVYGGATKIKGYVFESPKLPEIRGASALLDRVGEHGINQVWQRSLPVETTDRHHPCIIFAGGGSFLAFAPADLAQELATAVELEYTTQTLTANSVAVSASFNLLELRYGRLYPSGQTGEPYWVERFIADCKDKCKSAALLAYYYPPAGVNPEDTSDEALRRRFFNRKTFGELVTVLATMFNRRRDERASHGETRYLPHYELLPWAEKCKSSDARPAVIEVIVGSDKRLLSEPSARKLAVGRKVKGVDVGDLDSRLKPWAAPGDLKNDSWEKRWREFLENGEGRTTAYASSFEALKEMVVPARDLSDIAAGSDPRRYIGLIYADGNNIGRLMATLSTPMAYHAVSRALSDVAQHAVFSALAQHLRPVEAQDEETGKRRYVHPFEILTIGGDDLFIIVPGNKAFDIVLIIAQTFELELTERLKSLAPSIGLSVSASQPISMRYAGVDGTAQALRDFLPSVGLSAGVLIAQQNTPFFFLRDRVEELLKRAKKLARASATQGFFGGAVDFMVMKSIAMVSDDITAFRKEALGDHKESMRRRTARPYAWSEFAGLLATIRALKQARMPRSQLYRLRQALDQDQGDSVLTSTMEYLYTRVRFRNPLGQTLQMHIERDWCYSDGHDRPGLPPWSLWLKDGSGKNGKPAYETIWPDLVEAYEFVPADGERQTTSEVSR